MLLPRASHVSLTTLYVFMSARLPPRRCRIVAGARRPRMQPWVVTAFVLELFALESFGNPHVFHRAACTLFELESFVVC